MEPIWLSVARAFAGLQEIPGPLSNPLILQWARDLHVEKIYTNDDVAWCALFMNRIMLACQLPLAAGHTGNPYDLLRALSFTDHWGQHLTAPALGCLQVFKRPEGAHVGLYLGESPQAYFVFGGNQSNAVKSTWIEKGRLVANLWPIGLLLPTAAPVLLAANGMPLSRNEA